MEITKAMLKKANARYNRFYDQFDGCKQSWIKGAIFGPLIAFALSFLSSGFEFSVIFWAMFPFALIPSITVVATFVAMRYTDGYGLSCIPNGIMRFVVGIHDIFAGTYVLLWVAWTLCGIVLVGWVFALFIFSFLFPLESLYYWIRYNRDAKRVAKMIKNGQITMEEAEE